MSLLEFLVEPKSSYGPWDDAGWHPLDGTAGRTTNSGERVSPSRAMALSTYYACIRNIAEDVAKLPLKLYRRIPRGKSEEPESTLWDIFKIQANSEMSAFSFRELMTSWCLGWGNAYAEIVLGARGETQELWPIHPSRVKCKRRKDTTLFYEVSNDNGSTTPFAYSDLFHLHGLGGDGICGWSIAQIAAESFGVALAAQTFSATYFGNGTHIGGVLTTPKSLTDAARKRLQASWKSAYGGSAKAHQTVVLEEDLKFQATAVPMKDAQFLESRRFQHEEVARWFRMPLSKLQDQARAQGWSTLDAQNTDYVCDTLGPWFVRWESEILRRLIPATDRKTLFMEHEVRGVMKGDAASRGTYFQMRMNLGSITPNEIREVENENPIDDPAADKTYMQSSMAPLDAIADGSAGGAAASGATSTPPTSTPDKVAPPADLPVEDARVDAMRPLFIDAARRVMRKECMAVERACKRFHCGQDNSDLIGFQGWLAEFHRDQYKFALDAFAPVYQALGLPMNYAENDLGVFFNGCTLAVLQNFKMGKAVVNAPSEDATAQSIAATMMLAAKANQRSPVHDP